MIRVPRDAFPEWVEPMAATLTEKRFTGPEWIFERKFDGIRLIAFKQGDDVRLLSRNRLPHHNAAIVDAIRSLPVKDVILDGEVTWPSPTASHPVSVAYHVFDVMWLDGRDVTGESLEARRNFLNALPMRPPLQRVASLDDPEPWERARQEGWEGVVAKRRTSTYEHRRSPHWLKMKCEVTQDFVVGGFTDPQGGRVGLGALLVGYFEPGEPEQFVFAGKVGTGFDTRLLLDLRQRLDRIETARSPFTKAVGLPRIRAHWVQPEIVVHVAFIEWTVHGKLRHSRLLEVRTGTSPREVTRT